MAAQENLGAQFGGVRKVRSPEDLAAQAASVAATSAKLQASFVAKNGKGALRDLRNEKARERER